ncbi:CCA tRNA nucleotidyltransferase [Sphingorhabdus sp.]|uniref:CCA tRNA nucleotidyltransferase n=1 Tax=Sphingorhabdus sp. TaxID=1902408 RepID=UPI00359312F7
MTSTVADTEWFRADSLRHVVDALRDEHGGPRIVGGAVRDTLLGVSVTDIDLATPLIPTTVVDRLEAARIKAVPTGIDHGTVTAVVDGKNYEITTLRRDVTTDGRRATVAFSTDWREDAARRDFTINALYADAESGEIFDYFNGQTDLKAGILRFIGDANQRIAEDYLRILRYFRFLARYGNGYVDPTAVIACKNGAHGLTALSRERIAQELTRLMVLPDPVLAVQLMADNGIFAPFLPELKDDAPKHLAQLSKRENVHGQKISLPARLLTLVPRDANVVDRVAARLKLSNRLREHLAKRVSDPDPDILNIREIAYRNGIQCATDAVMLYTDNATLPECLTKLKDWTIPGFGIKGGDLIALGLPIGNVVAKTLVSVEAKWVAEDFPPRTRQMEIARQLVGTLLSASKKA